MQKNVKNALRLLLGIFKKEGVAAQQEAIRVVKSKEGKQLVKELKAGAMYGRAKLMRNAGKVARKGKSFSRKLYGKARVKRKALSKRLHKRR
jgi:hypothetical protein